MANLLLLQAPPETLRLLKEHQQRVEATLDQEFIEAGLLPAGGAGRNSYAIDLEMH
jgi:hypothetical protein